MGNFLIWFDGGGGVIMGVDDFLIGFKGGGRFSDRVLGRVWTGIFYCVLTLRGLMFHGIFLGVTSWSTENIVIIYHHCNT